PRRRRPFALLRRSSRQKHVLQQMYLACHSSRAFWILREASPHFSHHEPVRRWMMVAWRRPSWTVAPEALLRFCFFGLRGFVGDAALSTRRGNACQAGAARAL